MLCLRFGELCQPYKPCCSFHTTVTTVLSCVSGRHYASGVACTTSPAFTVVSVEESCSDIGFEQSVQFCVGMYGQRKQHPHFCCGAVPAKTPSCFTSSAKPHRKYRAFDVTARRGASNSLPLVTLCSTSSSCTFVFTLFSFNCSSETLASLSLVSELAVDLIQICFCFVDSSVHS